MTHRQRMTLGTGLPLDVLIFAAAHTAFALLVVLVVAHLGALVAVTLGGARLPASEPSSSSSSG